jgi:hypothetical protein
VGVDEFHRNVLGAISCTVLRILIRRVRSPRRIGENTDAPATEREKGRGRARPDRRRPGHDGDHSMSSASFGVRAGTAVRDLCICCFNIGGAALAVR